MLTRLLTGKLTIGGAILIAVSIGGKIILDSYKKSQQKSQAFQEKHMPAMGELSSESLTESSWNYQGPMGRGTLNFSTTSKVTFRSREKKIEGSWRIDDSMLYFEFPDGSPHQGIFRDSPNILLGPLPQEWTATRAND